MACMTKTLPDELEELEVVVKRQMREELNRMNYTKLANLTQPKEKMIVSCLIMGQKCSAE